MSVFGRILAVLTGSPADRDVIVRTTSLAGAFGAEAVLLRSDPASTARSEWGSAEDRVSRGFLESDLSSRALSLVTRLGTSPGASVRVSSIVARGRLDAEIARVVERSGAELVALSGEPKTEGEESSARAARNTLERVGASVLLTRGDSPGADGSVLVPLECSPRSEWTVGIGTRIARHVRAPLWLGHVVTVPVLPGDAASEPVLADLIEGVRRARYGDAERYLGETAERIRSRGLSVQSAAVHARSIAHGLLELERRAGAGLIVLHARGETGCRERAHGSAARAALELANASVLVLEERTSPWRAGGRSELMAEPMAEPGGGLLPHSYRIRRRIRTPSETGTGADG
jgi:nucleotide-binding universal stress UspA family protein